MNLTQKHRKIIPTLVHCQLVAKQVSNFRKKNNAHYSPTISQIAGTYNVNGLNCLLPFVNPFSFSDPS